MVWSRSSLPSKILGRSPLAMTTVCFGSLFLCVLWLEVSCHSTEVSFGDKEGASIAVNILTPQEDGRALGETVFCMISLLCAYSEVRDSVAGTVRPVYIT